MNEVIIHAEDRERIGNIVAQFRNKLENLYRIAYLQGAMDQVEEDRAKLRAEQSERGLHV